MKHQSDTTPKREKEAANTSNEIPISYLVVFAGGSVFLALIVLAALMIANWGD